jgi:hypothetical protein
VVLYFDDVNVQCARWGGLAADLDESFDVADRHPEVVRKAGERMEAPMAGFPEGIREAWAAQKARVSAPVATGAVTRGKI